MCQHEDLLHARDHLLLPGRPAGKSDAIVASQISFGTDLAEARMRKNCPYQGALIVAVLQ